MTVEEAAALCRVSAFVMYRLAAEGAVPAKKVGAQWRFMRSRLMAWLAGDDSGTTAGGSNGRQLPRAAPTFSRSATTPALSTRELLKRAARGLDAEPAPELRSRGRRSK